MASRGRRHHLRKGRAGMSGSTPALDGSGRHRRARPWQVSLQVGDRTYVLPLSLFLYSANRIEGKSRKKYGGWGWYVSSSSVSFSVFWSNWSGWIFSFWRLTGLGFWIFTSINQKHHIPAAVASLCQVIHFDTIEIYGSQNAG
jgi:hypothetical protein